MVFNHTVAARPIGGPCCVPVSAPMSPSRLGEEWAGAAAAAQAARNRLQEQGLVLLLRHRVRSQLGDLFPLPATVLQQSGTSPLCLGPMGSL
mmetsp:Transcript_51890/g.110276  ORF Transcript_51890/g.110276 Transcript_51890/m.110276 type:complete len:92 (-) Transcript_51890:1025-1300(-)